MAGQNPAPSAAIAFPRKPPTNAQPCVTLQYVKNATNRFTRQCVARAPENANKLGH